MAVTLPIDLLYAIGDAIRSRCTLAALCRVSKDFNRLFTPILYASIRVQDCEFQPLLERISGLSSESHLRFTKTLQIGRNIPRLPFLASGVDVDTCIEKMPDLVSLKVTNSVGELDLSGEGRHALDTLAKRVLLASPYLRHLGLSNGFRDEGSQMDLHRVILEYSDRRIERKIPLLEIEELDLGAGFLPTDVQDLFTGKHTDYLPQLTDLSYLASLRLRNRAYNEEEHVYVYVPVLHAAVNLKHIEVQVLSLDIGHLLNYLCSVAPGSLTSLAFVGLNYPYDRLFKEIKSLVSPAPHLGHSWWTLSFTETSTLEGNHYMKDFIMHCPDLQYLACPMHHSNLELFKTHMPRLMRLHTLIITKGNFPDHVPTTVNVSAQLNARDKAKEAGETNWQPFSAHPEISRVSEDGREQAKDRARERGEKIRKGIAEDLFKLSREIWLSRPGRYKGEPLKYVGLGYRVYRWVLPGPGEATGDNQWERRVERLSLDEARTFKEVERALQVSPDTP
ncbi:hypothetical protein BKA65DRAFT_553447 [Rhexocercosporidium sp. MPI-PUGE-AT-0058]|nr:hypothetical protein BKA65DRAFT_553447 [Rhexocercosporidium sp. MPI-PUGE-AT-0058]